MNEADACDQYVLPKLRAAGWGNQPHSIRREYQFTAGQIVVSAHSVQRRRKKIADFILNYAQDFPIAVVEVKAIDRSPDAGLQQAKSYAEMLGLQFAYATNGEKIIEFDFSNNQVRELEEFPQPEELWARLRSFQGLDENKAVNYLLTPSVGLEARSYQIAAINRAIQAVLREQRRILIAMAPGTGKTFVSFQICWKLWNSLWSQTGEIRKPKILFLTNQSSLVYAAYEAYRAFGDDRCILKERLFQNSKNIYFTTYQLLASESFREQYSPDFFDLIVADECDRSLTKESTSWRQVLDYFAPAYQLGLAGILVGQEDRDLASYFGNPVFTYSLKQGIEDGFLAPYKVYRIDVQPSEVWQPNLETLLPMDLFKKRDYLKFSDTTNFIAQHITSFLKETDRFAKTIVFCIDQQHAEDIAQALIALNKDLVEKFPDYVCSIVSNRSESSSQLENFRDLERLSPVIVTTSRMLLAGVDVPTCKNIVIAKPIRSQTTFLQAIARGTRIHEGYGKLYYNILDFTGSTALFSDPTFDSSSLEPYEEINVDKTRNTTELAIEKTNSDDINDDEPPNAGDENKRGDFEPEKNYLKSLVIRNFKTLVDITITFQDINVLVGANNSGKSSVLQAIHFATSISQSRNLIKNLEPFDENDEDHLIISQEQLIYTPIHSLENLCGNASTSDKILVEATLNSEEKAWLEIANNQNKSLSVKLKGNSCVNKLGDVQKLFSIYVPGLAGISKVETYLSWGSLIRNIARGDANLVLRNVLYHLYERLEKTGWVLFLETIKKIFQDVDIEVSFNRTIDEFINVKIIQNNKALPIDSVGTGFLQTLQILSYIYLFDPSVILLDEPDSHLHPNNQRALTKVLNEIAQERGTQIIIATHSRHILDALSSANKIWLSHGAARICSDSIDVLVELGALDNAEGLLTQGIRFVFLTEDEDDKFLKNFLLSFLEESVFRIWSYKGCSNINTSKALGKFIKDISLKTQVVVHRDSDFLDDTYKVSLREQYKKHSLEVFFTSGVDIESYFCRVEHLVELNPEYQELVQTIYQESLQECDSELRKKAYEGLCQVQNLKYRERLGTISDDECKSFADNLDFSQERWIHGKILLKCMRQKFRQKTKRNLKDCSPTAYLVDASLKAMLGI